MSENFILEMAWKSSAVSAGLWLLLQVARSHSPAQRARLLQVGIVLLMMLPILSFLLPPLPMTVGAVTTEPKPEVLAALASAPSPAAAISASPQMASPSPIPPVDSPAAPLSLIALLWLAGAAAVLMRLAAGMVTLRRWSATAQRVRASEWTSPLDQTGHDIKLLVSEEVGAPLSWGWPKATILLSRDIFADASNAVPVLAHEVAHIRRRDWLSLVTVRVVVALYWFNPLVWLLERALLHEIEQAADAEATRIVQPTHYAETLLKVASHRPLPAGANSIAAGSVSKRILRILQDQSLPAARWKVAATLVALSLAAPVAALEFVPESSPSPEAPILPQRLAPIAMGVSIAEARAPETTGAVSAIAAGSSMLPKKVRLAQSIAPAIALAGVAQSSTVVAVAGTPDADAETEAELSQAQKELEAQSQRTSELAARVSELAQRSAKAAMRRSAADMERGAQQMDHGIGDMLRGAENMRQEATRLRDPAYRQRKIAEEAARGHYVTDRELVDSIPQLEKGAQDMVKGAADMRRGAEEMRSSAREQQ